MKDGIINGGGNTKMKHKGEVFILNKPFEGSYADEEGNVAHEIIDYFKADNGKIYIYNNPWGHCPADIDVDESRKYKIAYMLLAKKATMNKKGEEKSSEFEITHLIKIKKCLHHESTHDNPNELKESQASVKQIIRKENITYGGKGLYIDRIYGVDDESLYITFEAEKIYVPKDTIRVKTPGYRFQRNKGYIYSDEHPDAFAEIQKYTDLKLWKDITNSYRCIDLSKKKGNNSKTFLDLILKVDSEECYTNMLHSVLSWNDTLKLFLKQFGKGKSVDTGRFRVRRELKIPKSGDIKGGRTDVCAYSEKQRIVIENKVFSGLNGVDSTNKTTQLTIYHNWAKEAELIPICLISCPDFRKSEIKLEMEPGMETIYDFVGYSEISSFIDKLSKKGYFTGFEYEQYIPDIVASFAKFNYQNKSELFEQFFIDAISRVNP